ALIIIYVAVFVREYFWILQSNRKAWFLTVIVTLALSAVYLATKENHSEKPPASFWLIVGLPLLFIYALRAAYADLSFDVLNYHIFHSERALRGLLYLPGDFAPAYFPFFNNPAPDMVTGVFRHSLGFRAGTFINYLALLGTGAVLFRFFTQDINSATTRSVAVLLVLFSEQLLSEINNYMVDLLALPLLLQASYLALRDNKSTLSKDYIFISLLLGASVALKLTNLVFALPIALLALRKLLVAKPRKSSQMLITAASMAIAFAAPVMPHALYLYRLTSNPVFPLYNRIFKSPFWPAENPFDGRWGAQGAWQTLSWPFQVLLKQDRLTELNLYSGRMSLGLCSVFLLLLFVKDQRLRQLGFIMIASAFLWSLGTGYIRYGLFLEVLGGISLVLLAASLWRSTSGPQMLRRGLTVCTLAALFCQSILAGVYTWEKEWGGRSIGLLNPREYLKESKQLLRDRSLVQYLSPEETALFDGVGAWVETGPKTSAITGMLGPDLPYLNLFAEAFVATPAALRKFRNAVRAVEGKKMLSVVFEEDLENALQKLQKRGFAVVKTTRLQLPYYSSQRRLPLVVIEVEADPSGRQTRGIFNAQILVLNYPPTTIKAGEYTIVRVKIRNASRTAWAAKKIANGANQVTLGNKWLNESGAIVVNDDGRTPLPRDVTPGDELELELRVRAPTAPGTYFLMLDLVQEQVSWFYEQGSTPVEVAITVERW
ncbi:MAG TPA: hypothetical protein VI750_07860, partial [Pyrinomonadaceae bacterium]|nr:hypothetical protein [Pyrinomonadaceae bacterium]